MNETLVRNIGDQRKKMRHGEGGGIQKSRKNVDVIYGQTLPKM